MDREQTPLKQRQKRGTARNPSASAAAPTTAPGGASERAFRPSGAASKGRAKATGAGAQQPAVSVPQAKPPLAILRASPLAASSHDGNNGANGGENQPASPSASSALKPPPLHSLRHAALRVNTAQAASTAPSASPLHLASPRMATSSTPQSLRRPSGASPPKLSGSAVAPSVLLRPSAASSAPALVSAPLASTKLIAPNFQFASDIPSRLASCLELTNFTVVGALGFEGSGKSTLLSLLSNLAFASSASAASGGGALDALRDRSTNPPFLAQRLETQLARLQETHGVDLAVVCEAPRLRANLGGLVLLDTQPLLSTSHVAGVLSRNDSAASSTRYGALSLEQQAELASVQIAILLLSVCHYIVIPQRSATVDMEMVDFLRKVNDKMQQCRLPNVSGHLMKDRHTARLLFVANEAADAAVSLSDQKALCSLQRLLPPEWLYRGESGVESSLVSQAPPLWKFMSLDATSSPQATGDWWGHALHWARFVESLPASASFTSASPTSVPPLSLKEWLSSTARVWETIKRSSALTEEYSARDSY